LENRFSWRCHRAAASFTVLALFTLTTMSRLSQIAACAALLCAAATPAIAQQAFPATLAGHAVLPASR